MNVDYEKIGSIKVVNGEYYVTPGESPHGECFKDEYNYTNNPDEPCYCPEFLFNCLAKESDGSYKVKRGDLYSYNDLLTEVGDFMSANPSWYKDTIVENNPKLLTDIAFESMDWEYPLTCVSSIEFE